MFGVPNFFKPRWMPPLDGAFESWTSFYEVSPMRRLRIRELSDAYREMVTLILSPTPSD
jgi:hypothetical protein